MRLATSCILHFYLGEGSMEVDHCIQKASITADLLDCYYYLEIYLVYEGRDALVRHCSALRSC